MPAPALRRLARSAAVVLLAGSVAGLGCRAPKAAPPPPPIPTVTVVVPGTAQLQNYAEYNGYLDSVEVVEIRARVKGLLTEVSFKEGEEVKAGRPLYRIDRREYDVAVARSGADIAKAEANIANANAKIALGEVEVNSQKASQAKSVGAKIELDRAVAILGSYRAMLDEAVAEKASAESAKRSAEIQLGYTDIKSPIDGLLSRTQVTKGNLVGQAETTLLTTVISVDPLYVYFDVPERDLVAYQQRRQNTAPSGEPDKPPQVEIGVANEVGYPHTDGWIDFRENRVDTGTGTVRIRGRIPNPKKPPGDTRLLYAGLYARVRVPTGPEQPRLVLPEEALMTGQEGSFVYVVGPENKVLKRTVKVGPSVWRVPAPGSPPAPGWALVGPEPKGPDAKPPAATPLRSVVAIESGLTATDLVVVNGLQKARPGVPVDPEKWVIRPPAPPAAP